MPQITGKEIGPIGYGMMGLAIKPDQTFEALDAALEQGCNFWNGGEFYGPPDGNSLALLEKYLAARPEGTADKIVLSVKGCFSVATRTVDGSPEAIRRSIDGCLAQLKGRKTKIDIYQCARRDPNVPLEVALGVIENEYVKTGKVGGIGLSEVRAETIHEAVKIATIAAVEVELSLWSTEILDNGVASACAQYGIPIVAYSPVGRGLLSGQYQSWADVEKAAETNPMMNMSPRFAKENFDTNLELLHRVKTIADAKGCTPAQLAINWTRVLSQFSSSLKKALPAGAIVVPIPGSTAPERVVENSKLIDLSEDEMKQIDEVLDKFVRAGDRYPSSIPTNT
ncbi:aldo/keto reductase [Apiospora saccharicola]|uniref:Aldo/keto reductase n=1 Tax=Apiospora saccharicola TaxID=335842 RepID=A0ABR1UWN3_9PEZI